MSGADESEPTDRLAALDRQERRSPRRAHDIAFALKQALQSPAAGQQFLQAGGAYYRRLYVVNPKKIPAGLEGLVTRSRASGERALGTSALHGTSVKAAKFD